ncbi:alanyl aminopeptidase [Litorimonas taeanensis]|uniref:Aminopeptidase n=1 Tax=Litorimonas taeanensis TaxID=568099 RepID=A0A420WE16_9PROT|nr:M1 family metallopeptidase [Litorimonas taeanensis]RKQ69142.1 alanyl aminopeptidase [Litorimonas taeanensis]
MYSKQFSLAALASISFIMAGCGEEKVASEENVAAEQVSVFSSDGIPHAQLPDTVVPQNYEIDMVMDPDTDGFTGTVKIVVDNKEATKKIWMHGKHMTVSRAVAKLDDGTEMPLTFTELSAEAAPSGVAYLTSEDTLPKGKLTLILDYATPYNQSLNSAYQVKRGGEGYIITQFEPLGAREAFPSFDEPKYKVPFTLSITAPDSDFVYANTPEIKRTELDNGWIRHDFAKTRPLPTYLVAFGAGPWDVVDFGMLPKNDIRQTDLQLRGLAAKGEGENLTYALENTNGILSALEGYFGTPYPYEKLDIIAAPDYAFGAMENPGAIVYRESLLLLGDNPPLSQKRSYAGVHSHELAHQWFGNLVTPVWWEDIWLNEAFATWAGNKGTSLWNPEGNFDRNTLNSALGAMNIDTLSTTRKVREPLERSENVMDQFDGITYRKGGGVLSMFESYVGEEKFRDGVRLHMKTYADGVATGDDFFRSIAEGSGNKDVVGAMKSFVDQPGLPLVDAQMTCSDNKMELNLTQSRYAPLGSKVQQGQIWQIPVCAKFGYADGQTSKSCFLMKEKTLTQSTEVEACPSFMTPNENGSGYYRFTMDSQAWSELIANIDSLNTREALTVMDSLVAAFRAGEVEASVFLDGMSKFAQHPEYDVASGSTRLIGFMYNELPESREDLARYVSGNYKARFERIRGQNTVEGNLLAPSLAGELAYIGNYSTLRQEMALKGAEYLGLNGSMNKKALAPNMMGLALSMAMIEYGDNAYAPLLELATTGSPLEKSRALGALSSTNSQDVVDALLGLALDKDGPLTGRQALSVVNGLLASNQFGDYTWNWLKGNFTQFVNDRVADVRKGGMPSTGGNFCSLDRRDEVQAFMEANSATIPGYERSLKQTIERIELCAALKETKASELAEALKKRK